MAVSQTEQRTQPLPPATAKGRAGGPWGRVLFGVVILAVVGTLALVLSRQFVGDPTRLAPTRDPAWYTWRTQVLLSDEPSLLLEKEGPLNMLAGGYRITTPVVGALLNRVAGVDPYRFTILFMVGMPILTALALGAFAYQHRRDPLAFLLTMIFAFGVLLATPFVGYMDQVLVLYFLAMALPFLEPARTSWGSRSAVAMLMLLASLSHPSTTIFFSVVLAAAAGLGWLANRFSIRKTLSTYAPTVLSAAAGVVAGLAAWQLGIWGVSASFSDAVLIQPYPREFFIGRVNGWWQSFKPDYTVPLAILALGYFAWRILRRRGGDWHGRISFLWLFPMLGVFGWVLDLTYPYYRFFNTSLALLLLGGTGLWVITRGVRWVAEKVGDRWGILQTVAAAVLVLGVVSIYVRPALGRWDRESQWTSRSSRITLASVSAYAAVEPDKPIVFVIHPKADQFRAWAIAKLNSNIMLAGLAGDQAERTFVHVGTIEDLKAGRPTKTGFPVFDRLSREFLAYLQDGISRFSEPPMTFLIKGFNARYVPENNNNPGAVITPEVKLLRGPDWATPSPPAVAAAVEAREQTAQALANPPSDTGHLVRVVAGLLLLLVVPGLLASRWFGVRELPSMLALVPGLSLALGLLSAIVVIAVHRAPFGPSDGWASVALALVASLVLGLIEWRRRDRPADRVPDAAPPASEPS